MAFVRIPTATLTAAQAANVDSLTRFASGDFTLAGGEQTAYTNLITAAKLAGIAAPLSDFIDMCQSPANFRSAVSPVPYDANHRAGVDPA
jgi:hypothetical protein